ncbi:MAG: electron transport complex subunit RsxA [Alphaproteobacteria bacterium]|nr:electron transport complex subunit RsxA [Alphaproteobacteria bacterium]
MSYVFIFITAVFVNNIVLSQFLGICPFLGVSKKISTALGMGFAVMFVMTIATIVTFLIYHALLLPFNLEYMMTVAFILVIASLVQMVEIIIKKVSPPLYQALGIFLPLITTNCAVLGIAILTIQKNYTLLSGVCYALANAVGFTLAIVIFAGIRERLAYTKIPTALKGTPIALITASLLSMAFMGFAGIGH